MVSLSKDQISQIEKNLLAKDVTFEPLRQELLDHLICDVEQHMERGKSFQEALSCLRDQLPGNHLKNIETETMELLNKKMNPIRIMGLISLGLLIIATLFKVLHLPGAGFLLFSFLVASSLTLITGSTRSVYINRQSKGRFSLLLVTGIVIAFILGLCFKILHLPGANLILYIAVISSCITFPAFSIYFFLSKNKLQDHLLVQLIRKNQNTIETVLLSLIGFGILFNYSSILLGVENFGGVIYFIYAILLTGIYIFTLSWIHFVDNKSVPSRPNLLLLISSSMAFIMFIIPILGSSIPPTYRNYFAYLPYIILCLIVATHYFKFSSSPNQTTLAILSLLLILYGGLKLGTKMHWLGAEAESLLVNNNFVLGYLVILLFLFIVYRKERLFKTLIILSIAAHMIPTI